MHPGIGTPRSHDYDPAGRVLTFRWDTAAPATTTRDAGAETVIRVPASVYGGAYEVEVTGGTVTSAPGTNGYGSPTRPSAIPPPKEGGRWAR